MSHNLLPFVLTVIIGVGASVPAADTVTAPAEKAASIHFNRDVRPIFSDNCYACHGPDGNKRKAGLRLDRKEEAFKQLESGDFAIVAGDTSKSRMLELVSTSDDDDRMPPVKTGKRLTPAQIEMLRNWIEQGAQWDEHWSYAPLKRPERPSVTDRSWPLNPIDEFILARLEAKGLKPSKEADKRILLRRASFDLTGLPPSATDTRGFLSDPSARAYERLVDLLLSSPHYGERLAAQWLDMVRYADTDGFHADNYRSVYPYRDYVIKAFNDNMPFDQFTIEQIAGDLLPEAGLSQKIASTFNRLNRTTEEGGSQAKEYLAKYASDRVRTTSAVWLGATMGCAECHDHKFDPFTTKDFYSMEAFFADVKERGVGKPEGTLLPNEMQRALLNRHDQRIATLENELGAATNRLSTAQANWEQTMIESVDSGKLDWITLKPVYFFAKNESAIRVEEDLSLSSVKQNPENEEYTVFVATDREQITGMRLEALPQPVQAGQDAPAAESNFVLTDFEISATSGRSVQWERIDIVRATASSELKNSPVTAAFDTKPESGWAPAKDSDDSPHKAAFVFARPLTGGVGTAFKAHLKNSSKSRPQQNIRRFRISISTTPNPHYGDHGIPPEIVNSLKKPAEGRSEEERASLMNYNLDTDSGVSRIRASLVSERTSKETLERTIPTTLATVAIEPRVTRILPRGNWMDDSGEIVEPAVPEFVSGSKPGEPKRHLTRLDLANWIVSEENPMTARAFVNRLWKICFGTGLSRVMDDLGSQGEWPTHPELLDWLAAEFKESRWDVKHMVSLIVNSRTYRQSSMPSQKLRELDPYNRLLARQSRFRLEAEMLRDNALAVSGILASEIGGPSAKPYQPEGYWQHLNFPKRTYQDDTGANAYRRGLYTFWCRSFLHPSMVAFDAPSREECTANRVISNNPLQALVLLNDPTYVEAARVFAERILRNGGTTLDERLNWMFATALTREPTPSESRELSELYAEQLTRYTHDSEAAAKLVKVGNWETSDDLGRAELAAWTAVARVVLNLHEFITRY